jgi:hypothetical protein
VDCGEQRRAGNGLFTMGQDDLPNWAKKEYQNQRFREQLRNNVISTLVLCIVVVSGIILHNYVLGEQDGEVKYEDCRNKVTIEEGATDTWFKKFTCSTIKTKSGKVIRGVCVNVVTEGPVCQTVYIYSKRPTASCPASFPYLGYDDLCHTTFQ